MSLEKVLESLPVDQWKTKQVIAFDWYDGPRAGVCSLSHPVAEFCFDLLDEKYNPDGCDHRLFRLSELPLGSVEEILKALEELGSPLNPVWVPVWRFPNDATRQTAEQTVERIGAAKRRTNLVLYSQDWEHFLGLWQTPTTREKPADWFSFLGIALRDSEEETEPARVSGG